jgi:hypothetical protein
MDAYVEGAIFSAKQTGIRINEYYQRLFRDKARKATHRRLKHLGEIGITFPSTEELTAFEEFATDKYLLS